MFEVDAEEVQEAKEPPSRLSSRGEAGTSPTRCPVLVSHMQGSATDGEAEPVGAGADPQMRPPVPLGPMRPLPPLLPSARLPPPLGPLHLGLHGAVVGVGRSPCHHRWSWEVAAVGIRQTGYPYIQASHATTCLMAPDLTSLSR
jgi:hypothetical protein